MAEDFPCLKLRLLIEDTLGLPIWTDAAEFESRRLLTARFGADPFLLNVPELQGRMLKLKIPGIEETRSRRADLMAILQSHFQITINQTPMNPQHENT